MRSTPFTPAKPLLVAWAKLHEDEDWLSEIDNILDVTRFTLRDGEVYAQIVDELQSMPEFMWAGTEWVCTCE